MELQVGDFDRRAHRGAGRARGREVEGADGHSAGDDAADRWRVPGLRRRVPSGVVPPSSEGHCTVGGESITIRAFKEKAQVANALGVASTAGCSFVRSLGELTVPYTLGTTWYVNTKSSETARTVAKEPSTGKARIFDCRKK